MKRTALLGLGWLAAACASPERVATVDPFASTRDDSCYTVDLFSKATIVPPNGEVPQDWRGYSGRWGGGAWEGVWCHDLYVLDITPQGDVTVVETHAPYPNWGKLATAFRRTARIDDKGHLRMAYGHVKVEYWLENGMLYGTRNEGTGIQRVALTRRGV